MPYDICPSCGLRDANDHETGWCKKCAGEDVAYSYEERKVSARRERWLSWLAERRESA